MLHVMVAARQVAFEGLSAESESVFFELVGTSESITHRLQGASRPDVALLEFDFPGLTGLKGIQTMRARAGRIPLGVLVAGAPLALARRLLAGGADAVLPTSLRGDALVAAIKLLTAGERFVIFPQRTLPQPDGAAEVLSERELQVLQGICDGMQNKEIAHAFHVQEVTVKMHVRGIIRKLGARNRTQAAMIARDLGIV